jgi:hypothetical protein
MSAFVASDDLAACRLQRKREVGAHDREREERRIEDTRGATKRAFSDAG